VICKRNSKIAATFAALLLSTGFAGSALAVGPDCDNPNLTGVITSDISYSGEVFINQKVSVNTDATLTLEAGTHVTMCNASAAIQVGKVGSLGGLVAIGTELAPIVFDALDPATKWGDIYFSSVILPNSTLQHVILNDGGGNDPVAYQAPLFINDTKPNAEAIPVIDHVTINHSGANGLVLLHHVDDPTAASISNISISGSAAAAIVGDVGGLGGLSGNNQFTNNHPDRIILGSDAFMTTSSTWRDHGIPYELTNGATVRTTGLEDWPTRWILEPGVTLLVHPGKHISVGSGTDAIMEARGTEAQPVTITRLADSEDNWGVLTLSGDEDHTLEHVNITWGARTANPTNSYSMLSKTRSGSLSMTHVRIEHSQSSGMAMFAGDAALSSVVLANNAQLGLYLSNATGLSVRNSQIINNITGGILNSDHRDICIDAMGNYWGNDDGPAVTNTFGSACGNGFANASLGDSASRGVLYRPWIRSVNGTTANRSNIKADPAFIIADGLNTAEITVTLRDLSGTPQAGKAVDIQSTIGDVEQPLSVSDVNGQVTAYITSGEPGFATISATNITDGDQVAGIGGVTFWQGAGSTGGLISPNGAPYTKPELLIERPPFIAGFPMEFSMPMQNTQATPLDVEVVYGVTGLNIGVRFAPVFTAQKTLAPGEQWNAPGAYVPDVDGHQCVEARLTFDSGAAAATRFDVEAQAQSQGSSTHRRNTNKNPCTSLNAGNMVPLKGGLIGVFKHFYKANKEARKVNNCLSSQISFAPSYRQSKTTASAIGTPGDYDKVFSPPILTPPQVTTGGEITPGLATVMNDLSDIAGELSALITANGVTRQRLQWAGQANDLVAVNLQYTAFRNYSLMEGQKLLQYASIIDAYLNEMGLAGIEDKLMTPDEQAAYLESLKTTGFEQDTIDYLTDSGWDLDEVEIRLQQIIQQYENTGFVAIAFTDAMRAARNKAIADGNDLISRYNDQLSLPASSQLATGNSNSGVTASATNADEVVSLDPMSWEFDVGHASIEVETVKLLVKPLNMPINWSYELSDRELLLDPEEIRKVTLRLFPGPDSISTDTINIAVEGYVLGQLIGGISFEYYVPNIIKPSDVIFTDGFE